MSLSFTCKNICDGPLNYLEIMGQGVTMVECRWHGEGKKVK